MTKEQNKKAPNLRFKGFTNDWEQRKLGGLFSTITDYVANGSFKSLRDHVKTYDTPNYAYMIRLIDASNDWKGPWLYTDRNGYSFLRKTSLKTNDVLLSNVGAGVGKTFLVPNLDKPMTLAPNSVLLRSSLFNERYLFYLINTCKNKNKILSMVGISAQPKLNKTDFKEVKVNTSLQKQEQLKIEETLSLIENNITLQQRKLELLKEIKKGLLQKMFADKSKFPILRFEGFHGEWEQRKLGELYSYHNGKAHEQNQRSSGKYELINLNSISVDGTLKSSGRYINHAAEILRQNDLVMILSDIAHGTLLGRVAIIPQDNKYVLNQRVALLRPISKSENSNFMAPLINNNQRYFHKMGIGTSQLNISKSTVIESLWQIPKIKEQSVIGNFSQNIDHIITIQQRRLTKLNSIKKSLLQQMFI